MKYWVLRMVLPSDDPNIRYIEKHFSIQRNEDVIDDVRNRGAIYKDSIRRHHEMRWLLTKIVLRKSYHTKRMEFGKRL